MKPHWRISPHLVRPLFRFSSPVWVSKISYVLVQQGSVLVLSAFLALDEVGRFKASEQVANIVYYVETVLAQTLFPVFCRLRNSDATLRAAYSKSTRISMFWIAAASIGLALFAPDIVHYVLTDRWRGAEFFLRAQGIALFFGAPLSGWDSLLKARNRTQVIFVMSVFFGICFIVIFVPGVAFFGRAGAAYAVIAISFVILLARVVALRRLGLGISMMEIGRRSTSAALLAAAAVFATTGFASSPSVAILAMRVALFVVVYLCALVFFELALIREILSLILPQPAQSMAGVAE